MSQPHAAGGLSKGDLLSLIEPLSDDDLRQLGTRLAKSRTDVEQALTDLETESAELKQEHGQLNAAIASFMSDLQKLHISGENLPGAALESEGPVDFIGRMWEKVKPRDSAVQTSEHVGELRRAPVEEPNAVHAASKRLSQAVDRAVSNVIPTPHGRVSADELSRHVAQRSQELGQQAKDTFATLQQSLRQATSEQGSQEVAEELSRKSRQLRDSVQAQFGDAKKQISGAWDMLTQQVGGQEGAAVGDAGAFAAPSMGSLFGYLRAPSRKQDLGPDSAGPGDGAGGDEAPQAAGGADSQQQQHQQQQEEEQVQPAPAALLKAAEPVEVEPELPEALLEAATAEAEETSDVDETLLIEAKLTLGDGSIQIVRVRASDRVKEVAARFVREHSLKSWFEAPLRAYLSEAENKAEKFPVALEADLMDIKKQYSSSKN